MYDGIHKYVLPLQVFVLFFNFSIAYVEFNSPEEASEAHDSMQGQALDGRDITVDFALDRGSDG